MKVLVDTSVWSLALRREPSADTPEVSELRELIQEVRVQMIGPVRQEILSGIRSELLFQKIRDRLKNFPDLGLDTSDFELAAHYFNICRSKGVQGSNTDFLICALAVKHHIAILTTDQDFTHFERHIPIILHRPRHALTFS